VLKRLHVKRFKSLASVEIEMPALTVLFGPNAAGKSNVLDAIQALSRLGTERTISDALAEPIRGYPIEAFSFPSEGLPGLLASQQVSFSLEADLSDGKESFRYRVEVAIEPKSGKLTVADEYLAALNKNNEPKGSPAIELAGKTLHLRRKSKPGHPRHEDIGANHTMLSDQRLGSPEYRIVDRTREELSGWRLYYLDPRISMRSARPPEAISDIGLLGEHLAPFLFRLKAEAPTAFAGVERTLKTLIPAVEAIDVDLDPKRGTLDIRVVQDGVHFSSRIISEGTLRVLALAAIANNPGSQGLIGFEEPENGVHPRRLELIATLLWNMAYADPRRSRQIVVTTHSPLFCDALLRLYRQRGDRFALLNVRRRGGQTVIEPFPDPGPLFASPDVNRGLIDGEEDGLFEKLLLRGLIDG
jgi:predicted ATPase